MRRYFTVSSIRFEYVDAWRCAQERWVGGNLAQDEVRQNYACG
jgi:hypothetical protein